MSLPLNQSPSAQRQHLQLQRGRFDEQQECDRPDKNAKYIRVIIPIAAHMACATAVDTPVLLRFEGAGER